MRPGRVIIAIVLLTCFLYCSTASAQANCDKGWFGLQCRYKCRCTNNKCDINGTCQEGSRCQTNWFGPACQYSNIVQRGVITPTGLLELTDDYETTCSDNNVIKNLNVTWNKSIPFTWLRLGVNSPNLLTGFRLLLHINNSDVTCGHVTLSAIDSHTLDIHCSEIVMVNKVTLMWEGVSRLCYLYISEGRNVAIRQNSSQSSSYSDTTFKMNASRSDNAVDGNTSGVFREQSCTHTNEENNPSWQVNFTTPKRVNRYVLYNRDTNKERLQGFLLESFADNGSLVFNYLDQKKDPQGTYIFKDTDVTRHIQAIKISKISNKAEILTLCEVEAYGDSVCEFGRYGRDCENPCKCEEKNETCFVSTGDCPSGCVAGFYGEGCQKASACPAGFYGSTCDQPCPQHCQGNTCNKEAGFCTACQSGWKGLQCDKECDFGRFGKGCKQFCSYECFRGTCNAVNGTCDGGCSKGYKPPDCNEQCDPGFHGHNCTEPCPINCNGTTCDGKSGNCLNGCSIGYSGDQCDTECSKGTFGAGCRQQCSQNCFDSDCDRVTGVCKDCIPGKVGDQCDISCSNGTYGRKCNETCSKNCNGTQGCNIENGTCIEGCTPGYTGSLCDQECSKGTYGAGCRQNCSQNCSDTDCDRVTGVCKDCPPGKDGDQCDISCSSGTYGHKCNKTCSNNCNGTQSCNIENGTCIEGCLPGYNGSLCDENCKNGKYGQDCTSNCSQFCVVDEIKKTSVCHHESGTCHLGCTNEYEGLNCLKLKIQEDTSNPGAVAGPIIVVLLLAIIVVIGVFLWRKRKQTKRSNSIDNGSQGNLTESGVSGLQPISAGLNGPAIHFQVYKPPLFTNQGDITPPDKDNETIYCNTVSEPKTTIAVDDLNKFMLSHKREYFVEQFKKIPPPSNTSMSVGLSAENKSKNRYKNICPYDHSRVQLIVDGEKYNGDYINASYVQGYNNKVKFIASQGPSKVILEDFIRMLWEQKTDVVVMLTNLVEEGKPKCEKYWPEDNELVLGEIKLKLMESQVFSDCIIRKMKLSQANQTHTVTQFHYISWPDKGVPSNPWSLVDFEHRVASCSTRRPLVVHCSAGVGRTGTFIALQNVIAQSEDTGFMDFYCTTSKLRQDRVNMIQTVDQYIFLHTAAQFALVCLGKTVTASDIIQKIEALEEISASGQTGMENEFKAVCNVSANDSEGSEEEESGRGSSSTYQNSRTSVNKLKNRFSNVLPKENYRPRLFCETKEFGEYINAVLLPSLTSQDSQMLTQLPLPTTVIDFWRMVTQYKVSLIVAFEVDPDDSTVGSYLPSESNKVMHCGPFEIETMSKNSEVLWEEKVLSIMRQKKRKNSLSLASSTHQADACQVTHLKCIKCDLDPEELLAVVQQVRSYSPRDKSKVLYMCRNGADYSGLLCVLSLLLERMDNDRQLILPLVVSTIKNVRPQVIPTLNQYRTLYQVLKLHSAALNTYANCGDQMSGKITGMGVSNYAFDKKENENVYANF